MDNKITNVKILDKLYINQNLICLIISFIFINYPSNQNTCSLLNKAYYIFFGVSFISVILSLIFYTCEYCAKKKFKKKQHKLLFELRQKAVLERTLSTQQIVSILKD